MSVDLPAFGRPTIATSATSFSSMWISRLSPGSPSSANRGSGPASRAREALPLPPRPPRAAVNLWPGSTRSATARPETDTTVPQGTWITISSPALPFLSWDPPRAPAPARNCRLLRNSERVPRLPEASITTSPPAPPLPPSGPPWGLYFSRRKETQPSPPLPPSTYMSASSMNMELSRTGT